MKELTVFSLVIVTLMLSGCQLTGNLGFPPIPALAVAVASFNQPMATNELLAGTLPEPRDLAPQADLDQLDSLLRSHLEPGPRPYSFLPPQNYLQPLQRDGRGRRSSLATWIWHGRQAGTPIILVPQVLQWQSGSETRSTLDFFLIDTRGEGQLMQRLKLDYEDRQGQELINLVEADIRQIIKDLGL